MKSLVLMLGGWLVSASLLCAQVWVDLTLEQEEYLPRESLRIGVRITNLSGQDIELGAEDGWLRFVVESKEELPIELLGAVPVRGKFEVGSSQVATRYVDIAPYYDLTRPGRYRVAASVKISKWDRTITSLPKEFDVVKGAKLWEQDFGVPRSSGNADAHPEIRKYALIRAAYEKQLRLYVQVSSADEMRIYSVFALGPLLSFSRPEAQLDKTCNLHVLYQSGARSFLYSVIDCNGRLITRQIHEYTTTRPTLRIDKDGAIQVIGGMRRPSSDDVPSQKKSQSATDKP